METRRNRRGRGGGASTESFALRRGGEETAAGTHGRAACAAEGTVGGLVAFGLELDQGFGAHGELEPAAAAVNQRAGGHHAPAGLLNDADGFTRGAAGGPDVFDHQDVLVGSTSKPRRRLSEPRASRSTKIARTRALSGREEIARATSWPSTMPPSAGEVTQSTRRS